MHNLSTFESKMISVLKDRFYIFCNAQFSLFLSTIEINSMQLISICHYSLIENSERIKKP